MHVKYAIFKGRAIKHFDANHYFNMTVGLLRLIVARKMAIGFGHA
jgi:hypothetical protein